VYINWDEKFEGRSPQVRRRRVFLIIVMTALFLLVHSILGSS
jgi:hypothetical protein